MEDFQVGKIQKYLEKFSDPTKDIYRRFMEDTAKEKLSLFVGVYRDPNGQAHHFDAVKEAIRIYLNDEKVSHDYQYTISNLVMLEGALNFSFGEQFVSENRSKIVRQGTPGSGMALRLASQIIADLNKVKKIFISIPTWFNYNIILSESGVEMGEYRYLDKKNMIIDFDGMIQDIRNMPLHSAIVLQACAHNPTGLDPSQEQWRSILQVVKERKLIPILDLAYPGFATGDFVNDSYPVRLFSQENIDLMVTFTFSKVFGLYGQRVGSLILLCQNTSLATYMQDYLDNIIRAKYQTNCRFGNDVAAIVLSNKHLLDKCKQEVIDVYHYLDKVRKKLHSLLVIIGAPGKWDFLLNVKGLLCVLPLNYKQVLYMGEKWHLYLTNEGRIAICGIQLEKCDYIAQAIKDTLINC